ncbi:conserved Plasmodium protein, unknown function [Plasmodium vinckei brucechwatti]|uniref:Uncharacterized protein n=1 Tax=Plasmodium vinckei brucechwatti TaxID=119398 RepID=A0A6V7RSL8_PLAVN|nr:conserved Plasmodium protein, unknown function [Plasmodium vinckei brucechwatti]
MENINEESISVSKDEIDNSGKSEQRDALIEGEIGEHQVEEENDEKLIEEENDEKKCDEENDINMDNSNISTPPKDDNNLKCDSYELQDKKLRSYENHWKEGSTLGNLFDNETNDYIKYNTSPGLLETRKNINNEQSKNIGDNKVNISYQINDTEKVCMYNFNPRQLGYQPNNGLNPAQGYVFIYPHITKNSKPPRIKKKKLTCC